jgi:type VI secretion system protein ImpB
VVKRIPALAALLKAREQLTELVMYMDGKAAAEDVIEELLKNPRWSDAIKPSLGETFQGDPA